MKLQLNKIFNLVRNMGLRYVGFRVQHEVAKRTGLLKNRFPVVPAYKQYVTLETWRIQQQLFFFNEKNDINLDKQASATLKERFQQIRNGELLLFNSVLTNLGIEYDWVTNPDSGYKYDIGKHWTEIADYSTAAGDIKYVWEKSRFSYLYDVIRYDYHFNEDCAAFVFHDILSWIRSNPINCGPNYRCSQEMSLRVLNWTFALHYYRNSVLLTEAVFNEIQNVIYWHLHHIFNNINFSRIAVRNNHAITETLTLYLAGIFYPGMPGADVWKKKGKQWFEEEVGYQVYEDGTFLQFSMNYHRIVVQLLTWGIVLAEKNGERFADVVYDRAKKSVRFLRTCMVEENGFLPNYGANDGALFFKMSDAQYRDYRPQLQALAAALGMSAGIDSMCEDAFWYGINKPITDDWHPAAGTHLFEDGGYYVIREKDTLTFLKCGSYKDRPSQADNLHLDIWYKGENVLLDAGSYKYNTDAATIRYFSGTQSHNTVMLDDNDQMLKGGRFIWYYWTQRQSATLQEDEKTYTFAGAVNAFKYIKDDVVHRRTVIKEKGEPRWQVTDAIMGVPSGVKAKQLWHVPVQQKSEVHITAKDSRGVGLIVQEQEGWCSSLYGQKEKTRELCFVDEGMVIDTLIMIETT